MSAAIPPRNDLENVFAGADGAASPARFILVDGGSAAVREGDLSMKIIAAGLAGALMSVAAAAPADAHRAHHRPCWDRIEDRLDRRESRIDERHDWSRRDVREDRRDRRESRRDERVDHCPAGRR